MTFATALARDAEPSALRRELGRNDTIFFLISAMVAIDTVGAIAAGGGQSFTWLAVLFVTFFVPSALASAELGAALPEEGGTYVWVRTALGPFAGAVTSMLYWAGTPVWLGGSVVAVAMSAWQRLVGPLTSADRYAFGVALVVLATVPAVVPLRVGKWVTSSGAVTQIVLLAFFTVSVLLYGARHGVHGVGDLRFEPSGRVLIAVVPILIYAFVGVELPAAAAGEMRDPRRDLPAAIGRAGIAQALMYGVPTLAVLTVLPAGQITSLHGLIDAMKAVFTVYGGRVAGDGTVVLTGAGRWLGALAGLAFVWALLASGSAWIMGAGRSQAAACQQGGGPRRLGRISPRSGVPVAMGLVSGAAALAMVLVNLEVAGGDDQRYFSAALSAAVSLIIVAYLLIFPSFLVLRWRRHDLERPFRAPGGTAGAVVITALAFGWSLVATVCLLWPGFGTPRPDAALPAGFAGQRIAFEVLVVSPVVAVVVTCAVFRVLSSRRSACLS